MVLGREKSSETARPLKNPFYYPTLNSSSRDRWISYHVLRKGRFDNSKSSCPCPYRVYVLSRLELRQQVHPSNQADSQTLVDAGRDCNAKVCVTC